MPENDTQSSPNADLSSLGSETSNLFDQILDCAVHDTSDIDVIVKAIQEQRNVVIRILWAGESHQIVAERIDAGRLHFFNPNANHNLAAGTELGGNDGTPPRIVEERGFESIGLPILKNLLNEGKAIAQCPVPEKPEPGSSFNMPTQDWQTLQFALFWTFYAVAAVDGEIDDNEWDILSQAIQGSLRQENRLAGDLIDSIAQNEEAIINAFIADERDFITGFEEVKSILERQADQVTALDYRRVLLKFAYDVSNSSGGNASAGIDPVSDDELRTIGTIAEILGLKQSTG